MDSSCVVGLDPDVDLMPSWTRSMLAEESAPDVILYYNKLVIDAIADLVPVVKPQSAFYEVWGSQGIKVLEDTISYAKSKDLIVLLDAKRGDIGSTSEAYASAYLGDENSGLSVDALTLSPYLGIDSIAPFCEKAIQNDRGLFVCAMTSNPGAVTLQHLESEGLPVYCHVAKMMAKLQEIHEGITEQSSLGIVSGATYPSEAFRLREILPGSWFLVPGMGKQGGDSMALHSFFGNDGLRAIVSSTRAIMYPEDSTNEKKTRESVREATIRFLNTVNNARRRT